MVKTRQLLIALTMFSILIAATGCAKRPQDTQPIRIAFSTWPGYAHAFIARERGFFKQNSVEVELVFTKEYDESAELYRDGKVDGIFEVFADSIFHNSQGVPTKVVYVTDYSNKGDVIVAGPNINSLLDLKEKPVGIDAINSFSHLFVLSVLVKGGLKEEDLRFEVVPAQQVPKALDEGKIAAGHTWEPARSKALKKGYRIIAKAGDVPGIITDVLSFNVKTAEKRSGDVRAIVRALFQAREFIDKNKDESIALMARSEGMTPEEMKTGLDDIIQLDLEKNKAIMKKCRDELNCKDYDCLFMIGRMIYDFYGKRGHYFSEKDLDEIIDPSFLE